MQIVHLRLGFHDQEPPTPKMMADAIAAYMTHGKHLEVLNVTCTSFLDIPDGPHTYSVNSSDVRVQLTAAEKAAVIAHFVEAEKDPKGGIVATSYVYDVTVDATVEA